MRYRQAKKIADCRGAEVCPHGWGQIERADRAVRRAASRRPDAAARIKEWAERHAECLEIEAEVERARQAASGA